MTITESSYTPLRQRVDPSELVILAKVAACGQYGYLAVIEQKSRAEQILVEDGYLTHEVVPGTARSYSRFRLTEMGRKALALKGGTHGHNT